MSSFRGTGDTTPPVNGYASYETVHTVASIDARHGGPSYSVPSLCRELARAGHASVVLTIGSNGQRDDVDLTSPPRFEIARPSFPMVPFAESVRWSRDFSERLKILAGRSQIVHNHGLWLMPNVLAARAAERAGIPFVLSPRGMLSPAALQFSKIKKRLFGTLVQWPAMRSSACIHVTSLQEYEEVREFGLTSPVAVIPNGIHLPSLERSPSKNSSMMKTVLYLGRLHPKKSLDMLLVAWAALEARDRTGWRLRIVGPSERSYDIRLRQIAQDLQLGTSVSIEAPLYGQEKTRAYEGSDLFVAPTLNENFGLTVAEALAHGIPAICTRGAPWQCLETENCGWWPPHSVDALRAALEAAMRLTPSERAAMGQRGRDHMARFFSWTHVASEMIGVYGWLLGCAAKPRCIHTH